MKTNSRALSNLQLEKAATAESNAVSKRAPSASKQYMSCKRRRYVVINREQVSSVIYSLPKAHGKNTLMTSYQKIESHKCMDHAILIQKAQIQHHLIKTYFLNLNERKRQNLENITR